MQVIIHLRTQTHEYLCGRKGSSLPAVNDIESLAKFHFQPSERGRACYQCADWDRRRFPKQWSYLKGKYSDPLINETIAAIPTLSAN